MEQRQGKCSKCKVAYRWPAKNGRLKDAHCPTCGEKLQPTSYLLEWDWKEILRPPQSAEAAVIKRKRGMR